MFAYCRNNPVCRTDSTGTEDEDATDNDEEGFLDGLIAIFKAMSDERSEGNTFSVGMVAGNSVGGSVGSRSYCISTDSSQNFAVQDTSSVGGATGHGGSLGLSFTWTNATDVQDLQGESKSQGFTVVALVGFAIDFITFNPASDPDTTKYGVSVSILGGADVDIHSQTNFTSSSKSWNPLKDFVKWLEGL